MNLDNIIASLKTAVLSAAISLGASLAGGLIAIAMGASQELKKVLVDTMTKFHDSYEARKAASELLIDAVEGAANDARNVFCADMEAFGAKEADALITLFTSALKSIAV